MSGPATSINRQITWDSICDRIGLQATGRVFPLRTTCTRCRGSLVIYHDTGSTGPWYFCEGCDQGGDLIELAAREWNTDAEGAALRLQSQGVLRFDKRQLDDYLRIHVGSRERLLKLQEDGQRLVANADIRVVRLLHKLHAGTGFTSGYQRIYEGLSHLVALAGNRELSTAITPHVATLGRETSGGRRFRGGNWKDVLWAPFESLPGRIQSLYAIGRRCRVPEDEVFSRVLLSQTREGGLAGMSSLSLAKDTSRVIAVGNFPFMLQAQVRSLHTSKNLLPMVVWRDDGKLRTQRAWDCLSGSEVVFWSPTGLDFPTLRQAIIADGLISTVGPANMDIRTYFRCHTARNVFRRVVDDAEPWNQVLGQWLKKATDAEARKLMLKLESAGEDMDHIRQKLESRRHKMPEYRERRKEIVFDSFTVAERDDQWFRTGNSYEKSTREVSNAVLRVCHMFEDDGQWWVDGHVSHRGRQYPFVVPRDAIREKPAFWLETFLLNQGVTSFRYLDAWSKKLWTVAVRFHEPHVIETTAAKRRREIGI